MKQRLGIAQVLLHDPKVLIMDEPNRGTDRNAVTGYMAPVLYNVLDLMGSLGSFTMFSMMRNGTMDGKWVLFIIGICCIVTSIWSRGSSRRCPCEN